MTLLRPSPLSLFALTLPYSDPSPGVCLARSSFNTSYILQDSAFVFLPCDSNPTQWRGDERLIGIPFPAPPGAH